MALAAEALLKLRAVFDGQGFDQARKALGGIEKQADGAKRSFKSVIDSSAWQGAAVAATGIGAGLIYSAKKAMELETQMVQVRKVVEFDSPNGLKQLTQDLVDLSTKIPYTARELGELAAAAGQAGYAEKDIMKFVTAAATMGTAFNMSAKDAGDAMIAFQAAMGLPLDDAIKLGDAINHLSDNIQGVVEPEALVEVTKRIGAIGVASGLSAKEVAALGAAFLAPGTKADVAATGLKNFLKALTQGEAGSKSFREAMDKLMGMPNAAQWVAKNMQIDPKGTIMRVIEQLRKVPKEFQAGLISDIFGEESKAAIQPLLTNTKLLADAFGLVADEGKFAGSMTKEFNNQLNSTEAQLKIFKNNIDALAIGLGAALLPGINAIVKALLPFVQALAAATQRVPGLSAVIVGLGVALAGLVISAPFLVSIMTLMRTVGGLAGAAGALRGLGSALSTVLRGNAGAGLFSGILNAAKALPGQVMAALRGLGLALASVFRPIGGGPGLFSGILAGARALPGLVMGALRGLPGMLRGLGGGIFAKNIRLEPNIPNIRLEKVGNPLPWLGRLGPTLAALGARLLTLGSVVARVFMGPVGWVTLLVTAGVALYAFRDKISAFIANVGPKLAKLFEPLKNLALGQPKQGQGQPGQPQQQSNPIESFLAGLNPVMLGARIGQALSQAFAGLGPRLQLLGQQLWNGITTALAGIGERFSTIWTQITTSFNTYVVLPLQTLWNFLVVWVGQTIAAYVIVWWQGVVSGFNTQVVLPLQMAWTGLMNMLRLGVQSLGQMWAGISQAFIQWVVTPVQQGWNQLVTFLQQGINSLRTMLSQVWQGVSVAFMQGVVRPIQQGWQSLVTMLTSSTGPLRMALSTAWQGVSQAFNSMVVIPVQQAWNGLTMTIGNAARRMVTAFQGAWQNVASGIRNGVIVPLETMFTNLANRIRGVFDGLLNWARNLGNSIIDKVNPVRANAGFQPLQRFAKGGYVSGPTLAWVGEGRDSEYIIPSGKMAGAAMAYLSGARGASVLSGANNIRGFAKGGFVKSKKGKKGKKGKSRNDANNIFSMSAGRSASEKPTSSPSSIANTESRNDANNIFSMSAGRSASKKPKGVNYRIRGKEYFAPFVNGVADLSGIGGPGLFGVGYYKKQMHGGMMDPAEWRKPWMFAKGGYVRGFAKGGFVKGKKGKKGKKGGAGISQTMGINPWVLSKLQSQNVDNSLFKYFQPGAPPGSAAITTALLNPGENIEYIDQYGLFDNNKNLKRDLMKIKNLTIKKMSFWKRGGAQAVNVAKPGKPYAEGVSWAQKTRIGGRWIDEDQPGYANGAYITRPTLGWIGEGRDSEYIIPSKRMAASSMAYLAGARGMGVVNPPRFANGGVVGSTTNRSADLNNLLDRANLGRGDTVVVSPPEPTINANYQIQTGEVRQEPDGTQWVRMSDLPKILDQHGKQLMGTLRSSQGRRAIGL